MSIFKKNDERVLVPLWYKSSEAAHLPELKSLVANKIQHDFFDTTSNLYNEFLQNKDIGVAVDLLNTSVMEGRTKEALIAADFVLSGFELPFQVLSLANKVKGQDIHVELKDDDISIEISILRNFLKDNPKDCLSWIDLSRLYISLGEMKAAKKCMIVGLGLSEKHRWVTRVGARFFYNIEEYDRAHQILLKHPNIKYDPWLISAELAVSSGYGRPTKLWTQAKKALEKGSLPYHLSELQSSVGTLELNSGAVRKAKKYFVDSLLYPNSNILAQAIWVERSSDIKGLVDGKKLKDQKRAFEAKSWEAYASQNIYGALEFCKKWIEEEPYTLEPIIHASYLAALLDNYNETLRISKKGLAIDSSDETLKLNVIFSEISLAEFEYKNIDQDKIDNAINVINLLVKHEDKSVVAHAYANLGLIFYKTGDIYKGKEWYESSVEVFKSLSHPSIVLVQLNHLREALLSKAPWAEEQFTKIEGLIKNGGIWNDPSAHYYLRKLKKVKENIDDWRVYLLDDKHPEEIVEINEKVKKQNVKFDFNPKNPTIWISPKK